MPDATWSVEWGDATWGEGEASESLGITDLAGNPMTSPSQVSCLGYTNVEAAYSSNRIYDAHIQSIRDADFQAGLFWKRFCEGPERIRVSQKDLILSIANLANANKVSDEHLKFLPLTYGWDQQSKALILDKIESSKLRAVVAQSHDLWDRRGVKGSIIEAMNALVGVRAFEFDWFDKRWLLGQNAIEDNACMLSISGRREFQILIADANRQLDRELLVNITKKWRPSGERVTLTFCEFLDFFDDDSQGWQAQSGAFSISDGAMAIPGAGTSRVMLPDERSNLSDAIIKSTMTFVGNAEFGLLARSNVPLSGVEVRVSALGTARIINDGLELASVDLESFGIFLNAGYPVDLRVHIRDTSVELFVNNVSVLEASEPSMQSSGLMGLYTASGTSLEVQNFQVLPLPGENIYVDINDKTRNFPA